MSALQDPEAYRRILENLPVGICVVDAQKKIIFWNDGVERLTGRARIEVLGHSCLDSVVPQCNQSSCAQCDDQCPLVAALHDGKAVEAGLSIPHKKGSLIPVHSWTTPLRDANGLIIGAIQTFEEVRPPDHPDPNEATMKAAGFLDDVTGLANRVMMQSHLRETLGTFEELGIPFGIVCLEATQLGQFRARYGPDATTSMLRVLAQTLRNAVWPSDFVGHWNEDRFLVILNGCAEAALEAVSQRMRKMIDGATIEWWGEELSIAVSFGRASARTGDTVESLIERALQAVVVNRPASRSRTASAASDSSKTS